jgi:hypothetical protein
MTPTPRRRSGWKLWAGVCAGFGLPLLGLGLWISSEADRRWEEILADGQRLVEEARRRDGTREVLRGEPISGRAWDDYNAADALLSGGGSLSELSGFVALKPEVDRVQVLALLQKYAPAVELFRKGAQRKDGQYPWDWSRFPEEAMVSLFQSMRLADFMLAQARVEAESGRARVGAEIALDVVRYWQDSSFNVIPLGTAIAIDGARRALDLVRRELMGAVLKPEDLPELERQFEVLDRTMPSFAAVLKNSQAYLIRRLEESGPFNTANYLETPRWRYGFSSKLQVTAWYAAHTREIEPLTRSDSLPWSEESAVWARHEIDRDATGRSPAPLTGEVVRSFSSNLRQMRARLRLLRLVLHRKSTGAWLDLEDPFGGRLRHEETETLLRVWSLGPDAVDHEGRGTWECSDRRNLVLEVPK